MNPCVIVPVTDDKSVAEVALLAHQIWLEHYTPIIGQAQVAYMLQELQSEAAIQKQINEGYLYFLVEDGQKRDIGYFSVAPREKELFLGKFYVSSEARGKGYGRQMMEFIQGMAREKGFPRIFLTVHKRNPSVAVYQKFGFAIWGPVVTDIGQGFFMDDYRMGLEI
jgi:GNAT superfamily N-acetyltransferase